MDRSPCPQCGAPCLATDLNCLDCGAVLRVVSARPEPAPEPPTPTPWWETPRGQRRIAIVSGAVLAGGVLFLLPGVLFFAGPIVAVLVVAEVVMAARERAENAAFVRSVERGGGDRAALQAELARHHRPDRIVTNGRHAVSVRGFDARLGPEPKRDEAR